MDLALSSVHTSPKPLEATFAADEIELEDEARLMEPVTFKGEAFRRDSKVHLTGSITTRIELACTRCTEPVVWDLDVSFDDVFVDADQEPADEELQLSDADLDESIVPGDVIDLKEVVREQILLEMPEVVLCGEDCKGLCAKCGTNRNLIDCSCDRDEIDPRWAALKDLN